MYPILALALLAFIIVGSVLVAIGVPVFFGMMAYDVMESRKTVPLHEKEARRRVTVQRGTARAFVVVGGVFWSVASLAGLFAAFYPLVAVIATLIVGWYYERITAVLLLLASVAVVAAGVIYQFDLGASLLVAVALIGPMLTASTLFWLARVDQDAYERATEIKLELAPLFAARSSLSA
jgi:hypothetical protein